MNARCALFPVLLCLLAWGCAPQRRITITSDPPGARVWLNEVEVGHTPTSAAFRFYGAYDVRLELDGYEPLHEVREAEPPLWEYPGLDLVALAVPGTKRVSIGWHFALAPTLEASQPRAAVEGDLLSRARAMRERLGAPALDSPESAASEPDGAEPAPQTPATPGSPPSR